MSAPRMSINQYTVEWEPAQWERLDAAIRDGVSVGDISGRFRIPKVFVIQRRKELGVGRKGKKPCPANA